MSDIKLFRFSGTTATALPGMAAPVEKHLQVLIENQMETFLGVRFLATEYSTGKNHGGRIDSLGLDENGCPVIVEYKRHTNENVINQGLFYLDWLLDHQAEFKWLVMENFGKEAASDIQWSETRLLCIAADFTKYDSHAVAQIGRNIELIRYKLFGDDLLLLELVNAVATTMSSVGSPKVPAAIAAAAPVSAAETAGAPESNAPPEAGKKGGQKTWVQQLELAPAEICELYEKLELFIAGQGDDIQVKPMKWYVAFKRLKNIASACIVPIQDPRILLYLVLNPARIALEEGFTRDVTQTGHWGTGDVEVSIRNAEDLEKAKSLIVRCYQET